MALIALWAIGIKLLLQYPRNALGDDEKSMNHSIPHFSSNSNTGTCCGQCAMDLVSNLKNYLGSNEASILLDLNFNNFLFAMSNTTVLHHFCQEFHKFEYCCSSCTPSFSKEVLIGYSRIIDHICINNFKDIKENFGCLARLEPQIRQICVHTCTPHQNAFHSIARNFRHFILNGDTTVLESYLSESCEYVVCSLHCDIPLIMHTCGYDIAEKVLTITKNSFSTMKKMSLDTGAITGWPSTCAEIIAYRIPQRSQTAKHHSDLIPTVEQQVVIKSNGNQSIELTGLLVIVLISLVMFATF